MPELLTKSVGLPWIGGWSGGNRSALKHKLMLGVISAILGALLSGCTAGKQPSREETSLANAAKDVVIPLEAGKMTNPLPETDEVASQGQQVFLESCAVCHGPDAREKLTSGGTCTRLPRTSTRPTCSTGATGNCFGSYGTEFASQACLPGSRAFPRTTRGSSHVSSTVFPASTLPQPPQRPGHRHKPPFPRRTSTPSKYRMASRFLSSKDTKTGRLSPSVTMEM